MCIRDRWGGGDWSDGKILEDGFEYSSDKNEKWMSSQELEAVIEGE